jgi:NifU-like protein involved in Fe-S cluster formation
VSVTLRLDEYGRVTGIAHETHACVLAQASSSILGAQLAGADRQKVQELRAAVDTMLHDGPPPPAPFADYAALTGAALYRNRHTCVLLPIDAVLRALETAGRAS